MALLQAELVRETDAIYWNTILDGNGFGWSGHTRFIDSPAPGYLILVNTSNTAPLGASAHFLEISYDPSTGEILDHMVTSLPCPYLLGGPDFTPFSDQRKVVAHSFREYSDAVRISTARYSYGTSPGSITLETAIAQVTYYSSGPFGLGNPSGAYQIINPYRWMMYNFPGAASNSQDLHAIQLISGQIGVLLGNGDGHWDRWDAHRPDSLDPLATGDGDGFGGGFEVPLTVTGDGTHGVYTGIWEYNNSASERAVDLVVDETGAIVDFRNSHFLKFGTFWDYPGYQNWRHGNGRGPLIVPRHLNLTDKMIEQVEGVGVERANFEYPPLASSYGPGKTYPFRVQSAGGGYPSGSGGVAQPGGNIDLMFTGEAETYVEWGLTVIRRYSIETGQNTLAFSPYFTNSANNVNWEFIRILSSDPVMILMAMIRSGSTFTAARRYAIWTTMGEFGPLPPGVDNQDNLKRHLTARPMVEKVTPVRSNRIIRAQNLPPAKATFKGHKLHSEKIDPRISE